MLHTGAQITQIGRFVWVKRFDKFWYLSDVNCSLSTIVLGDLVHIL